MSEDTTVTEIFIGGEPRPASDGGLYDIFNPARPDEFVGKAAAATEQDVDDAVRAAHTAFPAWSRLSYGERAQRLRRVAAALKDDEADIAWRSRLFTREHGKIARETLIELSRIGERFEQAADFGEALDRDEEIKGPALDTLVHRQPRGVAALVVPWNWPLAILGCKLPQALVTGNCVVVKPSANSALVPSITLQMIARMLPPGVVNILTGSASRIGDPLVGHKLVRNVNFTGSVEIGRHVMRIASENITPVTLELGGNDAGLVLSDAKLDDAAFERLYWGAFASSGQICMALKRLYVHESRYDELVDGLTARCEKAVIGDGLLPETTMGPVNNAKQLRIVANMIAEARSKGANVRECGQVPDEALVAGGGYFQRPALIYDADPALSVVREEQFGPALPVMKFATEDEAIALANDSDFGLCSSIWTEDAERAVDLAYRIEAGYTYLNGHGPAAQDGLGPFGGFKMSGIGRNMGRDGVLAFTEAHCISAPSGFLI
ncbi:MAG: aldehyde dehydrogenase family protein [Pseudomonadota bacterium]